VIPLSERHRRRTIAEYVEHYHREQNHRGSTTHALTAHVPIENGYRVRVSKGIFADHGRIWVYND
jgi:hypothetical protein